MTVPENITEYEGSLTPLPVKIVQDETKTEKVEAPEFASCQSYTLPQAGVNPPLQILPRRTRRYRADFYLHTVTAAVITVNSNREALTGANPQGFNVHTAAAGNVLDIPSWYSQQPLYAISTQADSEMNVIDQSYADNASEEY